jgi:hypothetical protein
MNEVDNDNCNGEEAAMGGDTAKNIAGIFYVKIN